MDKKNNLGLRSLGRGIKKDSVRFPLEELCNEMLLTTAQHRCNDHIGGSTGGIDVRFCYKISPIDNSTDVWCGLELGQCPLLSRDDLLNTRAFVIG